MNVKLLLALLLLITGTCVAQDYIGDTRKKVRKNLEKYIQSTNVSSKIYETDSSLVLLLDDPNYKPVDFVYLFDKDDQCIAELRSGCDTCIIKFMEDALDRTTYQWKQISPAKFISNSRYRLSMELFGIEKGSLLAVRKLNLSRGAYLRLRNAKKEEF